MCDLINNSSKYKLTPRKYCIKVALDINKTILDKSLLILVLNFDRDNEIRVKHKAVLNCIGTLASPNCIMKSNRIYHAIMIIKANIVIKYDKTLEINTLFNKIAKSLSILL
jgi:hypothetical protein